MIVHDTELPGVRLIEPDVFGDARGFFMETHNAERYAREAGLTDPFVQDNLSRSARGVLRGLHFQHPEGQGKLVFVLEGEVFDVAVDVRAGSPDFGRWTGEHLSAANRRQLWIPPGYAHGFCVLSDSALFAYKCTAPYAPDCESSVLWCDPAIGIDWPIAEPLLSDKDRGAPPLADLPPGRLPPYAASG